MPTPPCNPLAAASATARWHRLAAWAVLAVVGVLCLPSLGGLVRNGLMAQDPPANPAAEKPDLTADERRALQRHLKQLEAQDAETVRAAEKAILALGRKGGTVEPQLQRIVMRGGLEAAWRARRILNQLNKPILGEEWFNRAWETLRNAEQPAEPVTPPPPVTDSAEQPDLTLLDLLVAPARIQLHPNPVAGQYVTYRIGEPADDAPTETWAVVSVSEELVVVEHRAVVLEPVVMQYVVERQNPQRVMRAYGNRQKAGAAAITLLPIHIGQTSIRRVPTASAWKSAAVQAYDGPAGKFPQARTVTHTIAVPDIDGEVEIEVRDTADASVPFSGLLKRHDVEIDLPMLELLRTGSNHTSTARIGETKLVKLRGLTYEIPLSEYQAHQEALDAGNHDPETWPWPRLRTEESRPDNNPDFREQD